MIRKASFLLLIIHFFGLSAEDFPIPKVPNDIEIAGMKLRITHEAQKEIQKDVNALRASEKYFNIKLDRANLYFPIIEKALREEGVPDDMKYLSLQESALISDQVSTSDAVGYWQFKDFTAREVGLRVDSKVDERKNVVASTHGAAKYLKRNNFMLKNWIYSVNAYMTGLGGVKPYIDKDQIGSDRLTITDKTHWYVKRFIAHVIAFREDVGKPHSEGMELMVYRQGGNKDLKEIAKKLEVNEDLVLQYNKWLSYGKVPDDREYPVIIPVKGKQPRLSEPRRQEIVQKTSYPEKIVDEINTMSKTIFLEINDRQTVLAIAGDDLKSLAIKSGKTTEKLRKFNDMTEDQSIEEGAFYFTKSKRNKSGIRYHVAQYDESLWDVAQRYGIKLKKLRKKNGMEDTEKLKPGRILWLKQKQPKDMPPVYRKVALPTVVRPKPPKTIKPGFTSPAQPVPEPVVKKSIEPVTPEPTPQESIADKPEETNLVTQSSPPDASKSNQEIAVHEVAAGQSLYGIAKQYDITIEDLLEWNGLRKHDPINTGQKLMVVAPYEMSTSEAYVENSLPPAAGNESKHVVEPDDTYYSISKKYEIEIGEILKRNQLDVNMPIKPGQELIIPSIPQKMVTNPNTSSSDRTYTVQAGDTFYKIASQFKLSVEELMQINEKERPDLSIGEVLKIVK